MIPGTGARLASCTCPIVNSSSKVALKHVNAQRKRSLVRGADRWPLFDDTGLTGYQSRKTHSGKSALQGVRRRGARETFEMVSTLETLSLIATIVAVPVMIIGWFFSSRRKINKSVASRGATATTGDVHSGTAGIVTGHHSPVNLNLTVSENESHAYERRHAAFRAVRSLIDDVHSHKFLPSETLRSFVEFEKDARFLFDRELAAYLSDIREHATSLQSITMVMDGLPAGDQKAAASRTAGEHRLWLISQNDLLIEKFQPFLNFKACSDEGSLPPLPPRPDWPIRELFFHIRPDIRDDPKKHLWESVGRVIRDKFSTGQLRVWGRRIEDSRRLALAEIPADQWERAEFTYWFLVEQDGQSLDVNCYRPVRGAQPIQYADLHVSRAQAAALWKV